MKLRARDPEKNVAHVHHARVTEHPIEPLLRERDEADVNDVADNSTMKSVLQCCAPSGKSGSATRRSP